MPSARRARACRRTRPRRGSGGASPCAPRGRSARRSRSCARPGARAAAPAAGRCGAGKRRTPRGRPAPRSRRRSAAGPDSEARSAPRTNALTHLTTWPPSGFLGSLGRPRRGSPEVCRLHRLSNENPQLGCSTSCIPSSSSCSCVTSDGAPLIGSTPGLVLRERDHVAEVRLAGEHHRHPVDPERDPARAAARPSRARRAGSRTSTAARSGVSPSSSNTRAWISGSWIRKVPPPSSLPLTIRS